MINYPAVYTAVSEEEMVYLEGGVSAAGIKNFLVLTRTDPLAAAKKLWQKGKKFKSFFDWVIGDYMRDSVVMTDFRNDLWASAKKGNLDAFDARRDSIGDMALPGQVLYAYGIFRVGEKVASYFVS